MVFMYLTSGLRLKQLPTKPFCMQKSAKRLRKKIVYEFRNDRSMLLPVYILIFSAGIILIGVALKYLNDSLYLLRNGVSTEAIVTDIITVKDGDGDSYKPVFTFTDQAGGQVRVEYPISSNPLVWKRGEAVSLVYDPSMPTSAKVVSYWGLFSVSIICAMIAAPLITVSLGYFGFLAFANSLLISQYP